MDNLTLEQLEQIPWIRRYYQGTDAPPEPPLEEIPRLLSLPFMKRPRKYNLFFIWNEIIKLVPSSALTVLDCACGRGQIAQTLYFKGHDVHACDVVDSFKGSNEIRFQVSDMNSEFPYGTAFFDVILISAALHYLDDQKHFFNEANRILKPKGLLIFSVANLSSLHAKKKFVTTGELFDYGEICRPSVLYPPFFTQYLNKIDFTLDSLRGSAPIKTVRLFLFYLLNYFYLKKSGTDVEKFSSSLIYRYRKNE
jgi:SAM-dependent methyltransferase